MDKSLSRTAGWVKVKALHADKVYSDCGPAKYGVVLQQFMATSKGKLDIPMKVIFTDEGVSYFTSQQKKISRFKLSDGLEEYGIQVVDFVPPTIQRMQLLGYISKFELPADNLFRKRKEFIDLVKLLTYGMLYRQFSTTAFDATVESELIQTWNRHNIKNPIDHKTRINNQVLTAFLNKNAATIQEIKQQIAEPVLKRVRASERLQDAEKTVSVFLAEKFVENLNPLIFFVLTLHYGSTQYYQIVRMIQGQLSSYMDRSSIPEYLALMMVELLTSIKMERGFDPAMHSAIVSNAASEIFVLCRISRKRPESGDRGRLHFMISNKRQGYEEIKQKINNRITTQVTGKSLKDFYDASPELQEGMHLGLYYLSYLSEACKKVGINFESFVNRIEKDHQTTVHLILTF